MVVLPRLVSIPLRIGEFVFACVVAGLIGNYIHVFRHNHGHWPEARFIYTEVIAALSIFFSLIWLLPFAGGFLHYPFDFILAAAWFASFGLLVNSLHSYGCGNAFHWGGITNGGFCGRFRASEAFAFLSAIFWFVSTLVGIWWVHGKRQQAAADTTGRRRFFGRRAQV